MTYISNGNKVYYYYYYESIKRELKRRLVYEYEYFSFIIKSIKRELKTRPIYDCRCDERLKPKDDEST
jgi:hypothetical protein